MRNLKKILALALALVMSLSLMATANAFTDDDSINDTYETAVTVLSGLKVFQGYDDGSFLPQGAITRAEVAAIIYRIVTGDVADTQVGIYADYNKFDDVASTSWYAGYVNFCANAEYIKGYDARTFGPNDPVTGYQALAMILRALGYDKNGEFTGTNWQVQTAAVGESRGITKNITAGTLGVPATREVVAEILFQAILVNTVNYTPAFGYRESDTSLGYKTFGLEDIVGVVVANEYADLYGASPMDEGETELDVDGESYVIDYATTLEDIGEAQHAYVAGSTVLAIADAGNTVFETGAATDIGSDSDFEDVTSLERGDATEQFINFDNATVYEAQIRIVYDVDGDGPANHVSIRDGDELTQAQYDAIKAIFTDDDFASGWVIVGTKYENDTQAKDDDVSNDMKFSDFVDEYLEGEFNGTDIDETDNGEWLKVIDNDGDGVADYVFLTEFVMSYIERISTSGTYYLADLSAREDAAHFNDVEIDSDDVITEDEFSRGDVVIYTLIDGNYYMDLAEVVTETVDEKGIDKKTETMTCDGTDYVQSHIGYTTETYYNDVTEAHTEETYDLYLDHFGYVRLFIESDYSTFMLLTDGYYKDDRRAEDFRAYYWDVDAEEESLIDVVDNDDDFIWTNKDVLDAVDVWGNLKGADVTYDLKYNRADYRDYYATNIAGYSETSDGYDLKNVEDSAERMDYTVQAIDVDADTALDERELTGSVWSWWANDWVDTRVQTGTNTQYYLVIRSEDNDTANGWNVDDVITWTGYKNAPDEAVLDEYTNVAAYAVTRPTDTTNGRYFVADVVVFETTAADDYDTYFVYERNNWHVEYVYAIGYDEEGVISTENKVDVENDPVLREIEFYLIDDNGDVRVIDTAPDIRGEYEAENIYAGEANTSWDMEPEDYIQVEDTAAGNLYIEDAPVYYIVLEADGDYNVYKLDRDEVNNNDEMILFTDDKHVEYAIDVTMSYVETAAGNNYATYEAWDALYDAILLDATEVLYPTAAPDVAVGAVEDTNNDLTVELSYAQFEEYANADNEVPVTIVPATGNSINIDGSAEWSNGTQTAYVEIDAVTNEGEVIVASKGTETDGTGAVKYYTITVEVTAANGDKDLSSTKTGVVDVIDDVIYVKQTNLSVEEFVALFETNSMAAEPNIAWTFENAQGKVTDMSQTMANITDIEAVVTAEDGTTATYKLGFEVTVTGDGSIEGETTVYVQKGEDVHVDLTGPSEYTVNDGTAQTVKDYTEGFDVTNITEDTTIAVTARATINVKIDVSELDPADAAWDFYFGTTGTVTTTADPDGDTVKMTFEHDGWDSGDRTFTFRVEGAVNSNPADGSNSVTGGPISKKAAHNFVLSDIVGDVTIYILDVE